MYRRRIVIKEEKPVIPDNIKDFGYILKENGEVRSIHRGNNMSNTIRAGH
jgi:hypothetical protein